MPKSKEVQIYRVENFLWERLNKLIPKQKGSGRRPNDNKGCFEGIIYVMRTGCQWKELPKEYPPKSTVHDALQRWREQGIFKNLWQELLIEYDDLHGLDWEWLSGDTSFAKAPLGGKKTGANPTDRGKLGTKRGLICEGQGIPVGVNLEAANIHDMKLLPQMIDNIVIERPAYLETVVNFCLDKGFDYSECEELVIENLMRPHIRARGEEIDEKQEGKKPRRWVVERDFSWLNRYRRLLIRWEKNPDNYLAFIYIACSVMVLSRIFVG